MRSLVLLALSFLLCLPAHANVNGTHFQNFNPTSNGLDFVTVHSSRTLDPGVFNVGAFGNYSLNSLPFFKNRGVLTTQKFSEPNDKLMASDIHLGLGVSKGWDIGISLPFILDQDVNDTTSLGHFNETGLTDVAINTKVRVFNEENWGLAFIGSVNFDRIKNNPFTGSDAGPTFNLEAAWDYKLAAGWLWAVNVGYRLRDQGDVVLDSSVTPMPDQILYSTALSHYWETADTTLILEVYGTSLTESIETPTDREPSNLEILLGLKYSPLKTLDFHAGAAAGAYRGLASPDARFYAGFNWRFGPAWGGYEEAPTTVDAPIVYRASAPEPEEEKPSEVISLSAINFATAQTSMVKASQASFKNTAYSIKKNSKTIRKIVVEGHTDNVGKDTYNLKLSEGRANYVRNILVKVMPDMEAQIHSIGLGESRPIASNDDEAGRSKNRRVEIKIYRTE